jgi:putative radical SAM enzyme (TIGR03279 family)
VTALACGPERAVLLTSRTGERRRRRKTVRRSAPRGVRVGSVRVGSPADRAGLAAGDTVVKIDGRPIHDFLDFYVASFGPRHDNKVLRGGASLSLSLVRSRTEDAGAEVTPDRLRACNNRCIFCFVDQLPRGLRRELYFKDEDYRLSFLHGNYLTLTNLIPADERRIREEHLSPLYVSVHSTNEEVRQELLGRTPPESVLRVLKRLARGGVRFHTQVVIVPGYNDGDCLTSTLRDLTGLGRAILSVSVVPVGLTCHRGGLPKLRRLTKCSYHRIEGHREFTAWDRLGPSSAARIRFAKPHPDTLKTERAIITGDLGRCSQEQD